MLKVHITYEIINDESAEHGEAAESGFLAENETYTLRELISILKQGEASCSPASGATYEWITHYGEQDYRTGDYENRSIHFSRDNPSRKAKYWRLAMKAAGLIH